MSDNKSNALCDLILNFYFRDGTAPTKPAGGVYLALFNSTDAAMEAGTGTEVETPGVNGYARQQVVNNPAEWTAPSGSPREIATTADKTFGPATAAWGNVTHIGIMDASSGGNTLWWGALTATKNVGLNDSLIVRSGDLTVSED